MGNWFVSNAAMTLATVLATIPISSAFYVAGTDVEMCKSFNFKKTLYKSSTVAQIAERFEPSTVLWGFHTIQPSSLHFVTSCTLAYRYSQIDTMLNGSRYFMCVVLGYLLSCSVDHLTSLMGITPLIIVPLMLFGGYYLNSGSVMKFVQKCTRTVH